MVETLFKVIEEAEENKEVTFKATKMLCDISKIENGVKKICVEQGEPILIQLLKT